MKFTELVQEAIRVKPIQTGEDKTDTEEKKKFRKPGDVGPVDRLTQLDKDKPQEVQQMNTAARMAQGYDKRVGFKPEDTPDVPYSKEVKRDYNDAQQYADRALGRRGGTNPEFWANGGYTTNPEDAEMDPRFDPDSDEYYKKAQVENPGRPPVGWRADSRDPKHKEYTAKLQAFQQGQGEDSIEEPGTSPAERMAMAHKPGMDRITSADQAMKDATRAAELPTVRDDMTVPGMEDRKDTPYLRHGYQSSGVGLNKKLNQDDLDYIFSAISDDDPIKKSKSSTETLDKRGIENTKHFRPTARDAESLDPEAEALASKDKAYLTPEVMKQQKAIRDATDKADAKALQKLVFQHKVDDETVDNFINMYGSSNRGNDYLTRRLSGGATVDDKAKYGGKIEGADRYLAKDKKGKVIPGVYNYNSMPSSMRKIGDENRRKELVRTYLRQGGKDAYAQHEGIRSITDMDLEHIKALKGDEPGIDHPDNWAWASTELNRLKSDDKLTGTGSSVEKFAQGESSFDRSQMGKTWDDFTAGDREEEQRLEKVFGGSPNKGQQGSGPFGVGNYRNMSDDERQGLRDKAEEEGFNLSQIRKLFPENLPVADTTVSNSKENMNPDHGGKPYVFDPKKYGEDSTTYARDKIMYNDMLDKDLKDKYPGMTRDELKNTKEFKDFIQGMRDSRDDDEDEI